MAETLSVDGCLPESKPQSNLYHTLSLAVENASAGDDIVVQGGTYPESLVIDKHLTITAPGGSAVIGKYKYDVGTIDVTFPQLVAVDVCVPVGQDPLPIDARVYYPARCDTLVGSGGPFPAVVYTHGYRDPDAALCAGWPPLEPVNRDYLQAEGIIIPLVASGHIVISFDVSCGGYSGLTRGRLALNALAYLRNQNEPGGILEGAVDLTRVGFMGHSVGGGASAYAAKRLTDPLFAVLKLDTVQVKGVALIAPDFAGVESLKSELTEPVLIIYGTADKPCPTNFPTSYWAEIYNEANSANKHLLAITGANHYGYTDSLCVSGTFEGSCTVGGVTGPDAHARQQQAAGNYIHAFFSHYLQGVSGKIEYLVQEGEQQCIADPADSRCIEHPINSGQPLLLFEDLVHLNVEVSICSCTE